MDKVMSTRLNESIISLLDALSKMYHLPKKRILEEAIEDYARKKDIENNLDIFAMSSGAWKRDMKPDESIYRFRHLDMASKR